LIAEFLEPFHFVFSWQCYTSAAYISVYVVKQGNNVQKIQFHCVVLAEFKKRLDKFWSNQEIIYNYHAEIQGTGSRSVIN